MQKRILVNFEKVAKIAKILVAHFFALHAKNCTETNVDIRVGKYSIIECFYWDWLNWKSNLAREGIFSPGNKLSWDLKKIWERVGRKRNGRQPIIWFQYNLFSENITTLLKIVYRHCDFSISKVLCSLILELLVQMHILLWHCICRQKFVYLLKWFQKSPKFLQGVKRQYHFSNENHQNLTERFQNRDYFVQSTNEIFYELNLQF